MGQIPLNQAVVTPASLDKAALVKESFSKTFSSEQAANATMDVVKILLVAVAFAIVSLVIDRKE
jgi:hypothetical protein